jgi:hypothetical protein
MVNGIFEPFAEGFRDALRLFGAIVAAPFAVLSAFVRHADMRKPSHDRGVSASHPTEP